MLILSVGQTKRRAMREREWNKLFKFQQRSSLTLLGIVNLLQSGMKCCFVLTFLPAGKAGFETFLGQAKKVDTNENIVIIKSTITMKNRFCSNYFIKELKYYSHKNSLE
jgi:hypothetical protein